MYIFLSSASFPIEHWFKKYRHPKITIGGSLPAVNLFLYAGCSGSLTFLHTQVLSVLMFVHMGFLFLLTPHVFSVVHIQR